MIFASIASKRLIRTSESKSPTSTASDLAELLTCGTAPDGRALQGQSAHPEPDPSEIIQFLGAVVNNSRDLEPALGLGVTDNPIAPNFTPICTSRDTQPSRVAS
jgi:hypothetical protein